MVLVVVMASERKSSGFESSELVAIDAEIHLAQVKITKLLGNAGLLNSELQKAFNSLDQNYINKCNILQRQALDLRKEVEKEQEAGVDLVGLLNDQIFKRDEKISQLEQLSILFYFLDSFFLLFYFFGGFFRLRSDGTKEKPQTITPSPSKSSNPPTTDDQDPTTSDASDSESDDSDPRSAETSINIDTPPKSQSSSNNNNNTTTSTPSSRIKTRLFESKSKSKCKCKKGKTRKKNARMNTGVGFGRGSGVYDNTGFDPDSVPDYSKDGIFNPLARQQEEQRKDMVMEIDDMENVD